MCCDHEVLKAPGVGAPLGDPASGVPRTLLPSGAQPAPRSRRWRFGSFSRSGCWTW